MVNSKGIMMEISGWIYNCKNTENVYLNVYVVSLRVGREKETTRDINSAGFVTKLG